MRGIGRIQRIWRIVRIRTIDQIQRIGRIGESEENGRVGRSEGIYQKNRCNLGTDSRDSHHFPNNRFSKPSQYFPILPSLTILPILWFLPVLPILPILPVFWILPISQNLSLLLIVSSLRIIHIVQFFDPDPPMRSMVHSPFNRARQPMARMM